MKPYLMLLRTLLPTLGVLLLGQHTVQAQHENAILHRLKAKYEAIDALRAEFAQSMTSAYQGGTEQYAGNLILRGTQYRVETTDQTIVTNGQVTWIYNVAENQVLVSDYVEDETTFSINTFLFQHETLYEITTTAATMVHGKLHHRLHMTPKNPEAFYREIILWMRDEDDLITRLSVIDLNDVEMTFELTNIVLNPPVGDHTFHFSPPEHAEIIDLRS